MKKHIALVFALIVALASALTACADNTTLSDSTSNLPSETEYTGQKPFSDLNADDILSVSVFAIPPNETVLVDDMEQIETIVEILNTVVIYQESGEWRDSAGQMVTFTIKKSTGGVIEVSAYNPHLIIDGQGYKTEYQPCENLNRIANTVLGTRFGGMPIE